MMYRPCMYRYEVPLYETDAIREYERTVRAAAAEEGIEVIYIPRRKRAQDEVRAREETYA